MRTLLPCKTARLPSLSLPILVRWTHFVIRHLKRLIEFVVDSFQPCAFDLPFFKPKTAQPRLQLSKSFCAQVSKRNELISSRAFLKHIWGSKHRFKSRLWRWQGIQITTRFSFDLFLFLKAVIVTPFILHQASSSYVLIDAILL